MRRSSGQEMGQLRRHKDRAVELVACGKLEAAAEEYLKALEVSPGDVFARQRVAEIFARLHRPREAILHYQSLVGKYAAEGHLLKAIAFCHLILHLDGAHEATLSTLGDLYATRDAPKSPIRMPPAMSGALAAGPGTPAPTIDPETLERIPLFSALPRGPFLSLLRRVRPRSWRAGETIVEEGQGGDAMFAIATGAVRVERRTTPESSAAPRVVAEMQEGEFFGEISLLSQCPRLATVSAATDCLLLEIERRELEAIAAEHPRVGEIVGRFYRERLLANVLRASPLLRQLPVEKQRALGDVFKIESQPAGTMLLEQGRPSAGFFLLLRGRCDVFHRGRDGRDEAYPAMSEGDVFGEVSLLQGGPVTACVRTSTACVVLVLQRQWFDEILLGHPPVREALYELASRRLERTHAILAKELLDAGLV